MTFNKQSCECKSAACRTPWHIIGNPGDVCGKPQTAARPHMKFDSNCNCVCDTSSLSQTCNPNRPAEVPNAKSCECSCDYSLLQSLCAKKGKTAWQSSCTCDPVFKTRSIKYCSSKNFDDGVCHCEMDCVFPDGSGTFGSRTSCDYVDDRAYKIGEMNMGMHGCKTTPSCSCGGRKCANPNATRECRGPY